MLSRETGHCRVPAPPHISTGTMGESIAAIWRNDLTEGGIIALLYSIFHNRPHGKILYWLPSIGSSRHTSYPRRGPLGVRATLGHPANGHTGPTPPQCRRRRSAFPCSGSAPS